jgi:excisionase family DNA binding protein
VLHYNLDKFKRNYSPQYSSIYKYLKEGTITGHMIGTRWRFDKEAIDEVLTAKSLS